MNILYSNLNDNQFEELIIELCSELLGAGIQGFVTGQDGGRDARFTGTANHFPSDTGPWRGNIVVQAKHTELVDKKFSDSDFSGENSIITKELPRIRNLIQQNELDFYMLFANRRLTGVTDQRIRIQIEKETGITRSHIRLFDSSELDRLCKRYPQSVTNANLNPADSLADIDPADLAEVIMRLAEYKSKLNELMEGIEPPPEERKTPEQKNERTGLREEYFKKEIRPKMADFQNIDKFLANPNNTPYVKLYEDTASELEAKLIAWSDESLQYERLLESLISRLFARDVDLRRNKKLTRTVVFYMYCRCDIASEEK